MSHLSAPKSSLPSSAQEDQRREAAQLFNEAWALLNKPDRAHEDNALMVQTAYSSLWHWRRVGDAQQESLAEWLVARVYATLHQSGFALSHARRALAIADAANLPPLYRAAAHQGLAQALALAGDIAEAQDHAGQARELLGQVPDPADRKVVETDLAALPLP